MLKRELKINFKSFILFLISMMLIYLVVFIVYPSITKSSSDIDKLVQTMPKEMLEIFNMDTISINKVSGWLKTEGYLMITLIGSIYFGILGSNILLKEENDGTINFLATKPIKRSSIITPKIICGIIYVLLFNIFIGIETLIGLKLSNDLIVNDFIKMAFLPIFLHLFFFLLTIAISTFYSKNKKCTFLAIGIILILYAISVLSILSDKIEFLKYLTPFSYVDISLSDKTIIINLFILISATFIPFLITYIKYNHKELV